MIIVWKIENLEADTSTGMVSIAHWRCTASEDGVSSSAYGSTGFNNPPAGYSPIPLANLTEQNVLDWVWTSGVDREETEAMLSNSVNIKKAPQVENTLPWD